MLHGILGPPHPRIRLTSLPFGVYTSPMRTKRGPRQRTMNFKVTEEFRSLVERLAERLTLRRGRRCTLTDVIEEGVRLLAKREDKP
jgi:hypothetical protein